MRAAFRNIALAQALSLVFTFTFASGFALADNSKDEPTAEDLKNSKERNVILLPRTSSYTKTRTETKPSRSTIQEVKIAPQSRTSNKTRQAPTKTPPRAASVPAKSAKPSSQLINAASAQVQGDSIINVWLDKKGVSPQYKNGDKMKINVSASQDCNVMIFDFDGRGKLTQLYPNEYQQKTLLRAGDTITFGGADSPFDYQVSLPKGSTHAQERIFVYAYPITEKPLSIALNTEDGTPFRSGEMTLSQYRKMVAESKVFFNNGATISQTSSERDVKIVPKTPTSASTLKLVTTDEQKSEQPNKKEVSFTILGN